MSLELYDMEYKIYQYQGIGFIRATNKNGLSVIFCPVGASIKSISLDGNELLLTPKEAAAFLNKDNLFGKTMGPVFTDEVFINNTKYTFNNRWTANAFMFSGKPLYDKNYFCIQYVFHKKKNEDGLPGNVQYFISYTLSDTSNKLLIDYRVISDKDVPVDLSIKLPFLYETYKVDEISALIEKENYQVEILLKGYDYFDVKEESLDTQNGISISPRNKNTGLINQFKPYQRQILYRFTKK